MNIATTSQAKYFLVLSLLWYLIMTNQFQDMSVLIVDDEALTRRVHEFTLRHPGFTKFQMAENRMQAIQLCQSGEHYDIITMDVSMPLINSVEISYLIKCIISFHKYLHFNKFKHALPLKFLILYFRQPKY